MKLVVINFHFEYGDRIESILDDLHIQDFIRFPMLESKDIDGKHFGSQVFPGNSTQVQAQVPEETVETLLSQLKELKHSKPSLKHLQAFVLPIEQLVE